ncbi:hypothetical protein CSA08_04635 [Candidatus Gracilibacteria bacterium]|nr:MAG: hypothetical protein CSA08_04635 [Candidatus Gracilibacteria bacterium]
MTTNTFNSSNLESKEKSIETTKENKIVNKLTSITAAAALALSTNINADNLKKDVISPISSNDNASLLVADTNNVSKVDLLKSILEKRRDFEEISDKLESLTNANIEQVFRVFSKTLDLNQGTKRIERKATIVAKAMINFLYSLQELDGNSVKQYLTLALMIDRLKGKPISEKLMKGYHILADLADDLGEEAFNELNIKLPEGNITYEEVEYLLKNLLIKQEETLAEQKEILTKQEEELKALKKVLNTLREINKSQN